MYNYLGLLISSKNSSYKFLISTVFEIWFLKVETDNLSVQQNEMFCILSTGLKKFLLDKILDQKISHLLQFSIIKFAYIAFVLKSFQQNVDFQKYENK